MYDGDTLGDLIRNAVKSGAFYEAGKELARGFIDQTKEMEAEQGELEYERCSECNHIQFEPPIAESDQHYSFCSKFPGGAQE